MTNTQIAKLQRLNATINCLKGDVQEMLIAPVVKSIYDDEAQAYGDDMFVLQRKEIYTIIPEVVEQLAKACAARKQILDTRHA
ncbi:MAG: hypothetical protein AAGE59_23775 [Cyanobacteria bacterium P01_F01_bin.86]